MSFTKKLELYKINLYKYEFVRIEILTYFLIKVGHLLKYKNSNILLFYKFMLNLVNP